MFVAWKLLYNPVHLKTGAGIQAQIQNTYKLVKDFLATANRETLIGMVEKYDLAVYNLLPYFGILLHPKSQVRTMLSSLSLDFVKEIETMCLECIVLHLEIVLSQESVRDGLHHKEIGEFLACLPWWLPEPLKGFSYRLVSYVHSFAPLPVPKLSIMVRSRIARSYLALDKLQKEMTGGDGRALDQALARAGMPLMTRNQQVYVVALQ